MLHQGVTVELKIFRKKPFVRFLWLFMALLIFNFSADIPDIQTSYRPEESPVNDIQSIVEIVLDQFLGIDNAIPDYSEPDNCLTGIVVTPVVMNYFIPVSQEVLIAVPVTSHHYTVKNETLKSDFIPKVTSPPPEV